MNKVLEGNELQISGQAKPKKILSWNFPNWKTKKRRKSTTQYSLHISVLKALVFIGVLGKLAVRPVRLSVRSVSGHMSGRERGR